MRLNGPYHVTVKEKRNGSSKPAAGTVVKTQIPEGTYSEFGLRVRAMDDEIPQRRDPD